MKKVFIFSSYLLSVIVFRADLPVCGCDGDKKEEAWLIENQHNQYIVLGGGCGCNGGRGGVADGDDIPPDSV